MLVTAPRGSREAAMQDLRKKIKKSGGSPSTNPDYVRLKSYKKRASTGSRKAAVQDLEVKRQVEAAKAAEEAKVAPTPKPVPDKPQALEFGNVKLKNPNQQGKPFTITPKESAAYGGQAPVWVVQSANTPKGKVEAVDVEARYTNVPVSSKKLALSGYTRGQYEYNTANIMISKENYDLEKQYRTESGKSIKAFKGNPKAFEGAAGVKTVALTEYEGGEKVSTTKTYELTPEYFKGLPSYKKIEQRQLMYDEEGRIKPNVYKSYLGKAKTSYGGLSKMERIKLSQGEREVAFVNTTTGIGYGVAEFGASIGGRQGTIKQIREGVKLPKPKILKEYQSVPKVQTSVGFFKNPAKWTTQTITSRPSVTYPIAAVAALGTVTASTAVKNVKSFGLKTGITETAKYFSPIRIGQTTFQPNVAKELTKTTGVTKEYKLGDYTLSKTKLIKDVGTLSGGSGKIKVNNYQVTKTDAKGFSEGYGTTTIKTPAYQYIGGNLKKINLKYNFATSFTAQPQGAGYKVRSLTTDSSGKFYSSESLGFRQNFDINQKASLFRTASIKQKMTKTVTGYGDGGVNYDIKYSYKPLTRSLGYSVQVADTPSSSKIIKTAGTPKYKPSYSSSSGGFGQITKQSVKPVVKTTGTTKGYTSPVLDTTAMNTLAKTKIVPKLSTAVFARTAVSSVAVPRLTSQVITKQKARQIFVSPIKSAFSPVTKSAVALASPVASAFKPAISQMSGLKSATLSRFARPSTTSPPSTPSTFLNFPALVPPTFPAFMFGGGFGGISGTKKIGAKGKYGYTPSYTAVIKGIKGTAPKKKVYTGFELRPITKNWMFKKIKI